MSREASNQLTKSWIFVHPDGEHMESGKSSNDTSGVQEVTENESQVESDTDSFSVISESGCSYKTDEEEYTPVDGKQENEEINVANTEEVVVKEPQVFNSHLPTTIDENKKSGKLLYFTTSVVYAIILVGFSIAIQQYLQYLDVNHIDLAEQLYYPHVKDVKTADVLSEKLPKKYSLKGKNKFKLEEVENKISNFEEDNRNHDKIKPPMGDNDLREEEKLKSNYKLNKNKRPLAKSSKESGDEKLATPPDDKKANDDENRSDDETYHKKIKKLKIKEDYLKEKEKFLIKKEHDLLKQEMKLIKVKENYAKKKHDKTLHTKEYKDERCNKNSNKKYKEEKKKIKGQRLSDEQNKKRNISGQWYLNLHEARNYLRQKRYSNYKKNKAHWYFQWMVDRARLRVK